MVDKYKPPDSWREEEEGEDENGFKLSREIRLDDGRYNKWFLEAKLQRRELNPIMMIIIMINLWKVFTLNFQQTTTVSWICNKNYNNKLLRNSILDLIGR